MCAVSRHWLASGALIHPPARLCFVIQKHCRWYVCVLFKQALLDVVGSQASKALDEQCVQLEKELDLQDTHLTHLSGMQQSLALADQQHAKVLRQRNAQIRVLQQKLTAAQQLLQEQDAAFARSAERLARLDRVHGLNRQLESKITRLKAELATRESELEHAQMLLQQEADKAHAHRIDEAATR